MIEDNIYDFINEVTKLKDLASLWVLETRKEQDLIAKIRKYYYEEVIDDEIFLLKIKKLKAHPQTIWSSQSSRWYSGNVSKYLIEWQELFLEYIEYINNTFLEKIINNYDEYLSNKSILFHFTQCSMSLLTELEQEWCMLMDWMWPDDIQLREIKFVLIYEKVQKLKWNIQDSIIKPISLENIAKKIWDYYSATPIIDLLKQEWVKDFLINYPNTKWRMVNDIFRVLATSKNESDHKILFNVIEEFIHPARYEDDEIHKKIFSSIAKLLEYDWYKIEQWKILKWNIDNWVKTKEIWELIFDWINLIYLWETKEVKWNQLLFCEYFFKDWNLNKKVDWNDCEEFIYWKNWTPPNTWLSNIIKKINGVLNSLLYSKNFSYSDSNYILLKDKA